MLLLAAEASVLRFEGRDSVSLRPGEATLLGARDQLALKTGGKGALFGIESLGTQPCRFFELDAADPEGNRQELELFCMPFADDLPVSWKACHEIHTLLDSAFRHGRWPEAGADDSVLRSVLRLVTIEALRALEAFRATVEGPVEKSNAARVVAADAFVCCHIARDIRKPELAEHIGVSVSQLTLAFREIGQLAVRDRIRFRRVESARHLLADTALSVAEVAERVGMNYRHFIRAFRQSAQLTPLRYRKYAQMQAKPPGVWEEFVSTANFEPVPPLAALSGDVAGAAGGATEGAVSVLISNASQEPVLVSRLSGGQFVELGVVGVEKRLSFFDTPGSIWRLEPRRAGAPGNVAGERRYFNSGEVNSHFIFGLETAG